MRANDVTDNVTQVTPCEDGDRICNWVEDATGSTAWADAANFFIGLPLTLLLLALGAWLIRWLLHRVIGRVVKRAVKRRPNAAGDRGQQRAEAMAGLFRSIVTGIVLAIVVTMMLAEIGVNIAPIIASAGLLGIALGFGAQSLVKDFLSGVFIVLEDQFGTGDIIDLGEATGTVEEMTLRMTRLRDIEGTVWYVPNGEILRVGNFSQNWSRTVLDVGVAYSESISRVRTILTDVAHELFEEEAFRGEILEEPAVWGVQELSADAVTIRIVLKTTPGSQWVVAREMRQRIKDRFDAEGIEIPFPQRVVWTRPEEGKKTQPDPAQAAAEAERNKNQASGAPEVGEEDPDAGAPVKPGQSS